MVESGSPHWHIEAMQMKLHELTLIDPELLFWGPGAGGTFVIDFIDWFGRTGLDLSKHTSREQGITYCLSNNLKIYSLSFDAIVSLRTDESAWFLAEAFSGPTEQNWEQLNCVLWQAHSPSRLADYVFANRSDPPRPADLKHYQVRLGHDIFDVLACVEPELLSTAP